MQSGIDRHCQHSHRSDIPCSLCLRQRGDAVIAVVSCRAHDELKATKRDARLATNQLQQGLDEALRQCTLHEAALSTAGLADRDVSTEPTSATHAVSCDT